MAQTSMTLRVDNSLKKNFDTLCEEFGFTTTAAITVFMKTVVRERRIPFEIKAAGKDEINAKGWEAILKMGKQAEEAGIQDIRQKAGDVLFTLSNLHFEAVSSLCSDPDYKSRLTFLANTKEPTLRLKLSSGVDSLKQSKVFVDKYRSVLNS